MDVRTYVCMNTAGTVVCVIRLSFFCFVTNVITLVSLLGNKPGKT